MHNSCSIFYCYKFTKHYSKRIAAGFFRSIRFKWKQLFVFNLFQLSSLESCESLPGDYFITFLVLFERSDFTFYPEIITYKVVREDNIYREVSIWIECFDK